MYKISCMYINGPDHDGTRVLVQTATVVHLMMVPIKKQMKKEKKREFFFVVVCFGMDPHAKKTSSKCVPPLTPPPPTPLHPLVLLSSPHCAYLFITRMT